MKPEEGPWISLPSKHHPDKVYYFNVSTNVSTWEKPDNYCEPVDDSTTLQCLTKPTTPERKERSSYIVESLSPNTSPRKSQDVNKLSLEICEKKEDKNREESNTLNCHRDRRIIKNSPYKNDIKRSQGKEGCHMRNTRDEKNLKMKPYYSVPRLSNVVSKEGRSDYSTVSSGHFQRPETKRNDFRLVSQKYSHFDPVGKLSYGKTFDPVNHRLSHNLSFKDRGDFSVTRFKTSDSSAVYGTASLRLEHLKNKLKEQREKSHLADWTNNSSDRKWHFPLLNQKNSLDIGNRLSAAPLFISGSSDTRKDIVLYSKSNFSKSGNADFSSKASATDLSGYSDQPYFSDLHKKPYFTKGGIDLKDSSANVLSKRNCSESTSEDFTNDHLKLYSSSYHTKPYSKVSTKEYSCSSDFYRNVYSKPTVSGYVAKTAVGFVERCKEAPLLEDYIKPDVENNNLSQHERSLCLTPELQDSVSKTVITDQYTRRTQKLRAQPYQKTDLMKDTNHSLASRRNLLSDTQCERNSKTSATERLRRYKSMLLQAKAFQKQDSGHYSPLTVSNSTVFSKLHSFSSGSDNISLGRLGQDTPLSLSKLNRNPKTEVYFLSGDKHDFNSPKISRTEFASNIIPRKCTQNLLSNSVSTNLPKSSRKCSEEHVRSKTGRNSWEWDPPSLVRDYHHKRIVDHSDASNSLNYDNEDVTCAKRVASSGTEDEIKSDNQTREKIGITSKSANYEHSIYFPRKSSRDDSKIMQGSTRRSGTWKDKSSVEKCFVRSQNERGINARHKVDTSSNSESDNHQSIAETNVHSTTDLKTSHHIDEHSPQIGFKPKLRGSKGGIAKINHKVQKQLRTIVPKFISGSGIQKKVKSSNVKDEKMRDLNFQSVPQIADEEMEWESIEPEKVVLHVEALRREGGLQQIVNPELVNLCNAGSQMPSQWFIVLDTNVLLSHLDFLHELRDIKDNELGMPTLFIPWIVLQELDNLKSASGKAALHHHARKAVNFLYENLLVRHPRLQGQPKSDADEYNSLEPDDSILQCTLNLQKRSNKVLLLTNDHNLFNKAIISGVECCSAAKLVEELEYRRKSSFSHGTQSSAIGTVKETKPFHSVIYEIKQCIAVVLEEVLRTEMVLVYDRNWTDIVARKPPWTLNDVLFCLLKHWVAVFRLVLPSAARELIEKIRLYINNEEYESSAKSVENLLKTCVSLMHLVSSLSYKHYVDHALNTLHGLENNVKNQEEGIVNDNTSTSAFPATKTYSISNRLEDAASSVSGPARSTTSDCTSSASTKGEQCTKHIGNSADGSSVGGDHGSNIRGAKIDNDDDCLSLFASSFSEDVGNNQPSDTSIERGQELAHNYLNKIWEKVAVYCGMLCNVMGIDPCVPYDPPNPFPTLEVLNQNMVHFVTCVNSLLRCIEGILACQPSELQEHNPLVVNFCTTIKESLPMWTEQGDTLLPQHIVSYCTQNDTRQQLEYGKKQFEEFETVLNQAVTFFMTQNQSSAPLPSF